MSQTPAGWYVDAQGVTRWWDGTQWTEHTQPSAPAPQGAPGGPGAQAPGQQTSQEHGVDEQGVGQQGTEPDADLDPDRTRIREVPRAESPGSAGAGSSWSQHDPQAPSATPQNSPWGGGVQPQASGWGAGASGAVPPPPPGGPTSGPPGSGGQWSGQGGPGNLYAGWGAQPGAPKSGGVKPWMLIVAGVVVIAVIAVVVFFVVRGNDSGNNADEAPTNASVSDFCSSLNFREFNPSMTKSDLQKMQDKMREVGTPSDMPDAARRGWEWFVNVSSASEANSANESELSALAQYWGQKCLGQ